MNQRRYVLDFEHHHCEDCDIICSCCMSCEDIYRALNSRMSSLNDTRVQDLADELIAQYEQTEYIYGPVDRQGCVNHNNIIHIVDEQRYNKSFLRRLAKSFKVKPKEVCKAWKEGKMHNTFVEHQIMFHFPEWGRCGECLKEDLESEMRWKEHTATWKFDESGNSIND